MGATVLFFLFLPLTASAATFLFQGTISVDDETPSIIFTVGSTEQVTVQSYGYAGGNVNSMLIASGGFDPDAYIFDDNSGMLVAEYDGSSCITGNDPVTGNCDDPFIQETFVPGQYLLVITVADPSNNLVDSTLQGGFTDAGVGSYTCAQYGMSGNFCDASASGLQRTGNWAFAITGADDAYPAPEPGGWALIAIAGIAVAFLKRRARVA